MGATFLGVILDEHLTWKSNTSYVARKVSKAIGIIINHVFALKIPPYGHIHSRGEKDRSCWFGLKTTGLHTLQARLLRCHLPPVSVRRPSFP